MVVVVGGSSSTSSVAAAGGHTTPPPVPSWFPPPIRTAAATSNKEAKCSSLILSSLFLESNELNESNGCEGQQQQQELNLYEPQNSQMRPFALMMKKERNGSCSLAFVWWAIYWEVTDIGSTRVSNSNCFNTAPGILWFLLKH